MMHFCDLATPYLSIAKHAFSQAAYNLSFIYYFCTHCAQTHSKSLEIIIFISILWCISAILQILIFLRNICFLANCTVLLPNPYKICRLLLILEPLARKDTKIIKSIRFSLSRDGVAPCAKPLIKPYGNHPFERPNGRCCGAHGDPKIVLLLRFSKLLLFQT